MQRIEALLRSCAGENIEDAFRALADCGLLIERHALGWYGDESYTELLDEDHLNIVLDDESYVKMISEIGKILLECSDRARGAAWAIGKSYDSQIAGILVRALDMYWDKDDEVSKQIILSIENCGIPEEGRALLKKVAAQGLPKSRISAQELLLA